MKHTKTLIMEAFIQMMNQFSLLCIPCGLQITGCTWEVTALGNSYLKPVAHLNKVGGALG